MDLVALVFQTSEPVRVDHSSLDLPLDLPLDPRRDPNPRAVWETVFAATRPWMTYAQALLDPNVAHGIMQVSLKRERELEIEHYVRRKGHAK